MKRYRAGVISEKWKWLFSLAAVSAATWFVLKYLLSLFLPLIIAFFITRAVYPMAIFLRRQCRKCSIPLSSKQCRLIVFFACLFVCGGLLFWGVMAAVRQLRDFLENSGIYIEWFSVFFQKFCCRCDLLLGLSEGSIEEGLGTAFGIGDSGVLTKKLLSLPMTAAPFIGFIGKAGIVLLFSVFLSLMAVSNLERWYAGYRQCRFYRECHVILRELTGAGFAFVRTQAVIMFLITGLNTVILSLMGNGYALLIGILVAVVDALPVLGSGTILFPWALISLFYGDIVKALILFSLYAGCQLTRQFLEPRLMGRRLHAEPAVMLASIFAGLQLFSVAGVLLGPVGYLLIRVIMQLLWGKKN